VIRVLANSITAVTAVKVDARGSAREMLCSVFISASRIGLQAASSGASGSRPHGLVVVISGVSCAPATACPASTAGW
jgi:hypothetical protein